jgi:DNA polymerase-3 subunit delta
MIIKSFELSNNLDHNFFLFHGQNDGLKESLINNLIKPKYKTSTYNYTEKEILNNLDNFYNLIFTNSFFEENKLIIIKDVSDKIKSEIDNIIEKEINNILIILISNVLEKKSKLRNLFEKEKKLISVPFYLDNNQTLMSLAISFFKEKKISISSETINILINKSNGERKILMNELEKIEMYSKNKTNISADEINILTNTAENSNIGELVDNCLAKNDKRIRYLMNENNFGSDDSIIIIRTFLFKAKRLLNLIDIFTEQKNIDKTIASARPPIFWKDKDLIKRQIKSWTLNQVKKLILEINDIELLVKTNTQNSVHILSDFILNKSK